MVKIQQKISGNFSSWEGPEFFAELNDTSLRSKRTTFQLSTPFKESLKVIHLFLRRRWLGLKTLMI